MGSISGGAATARISSSSFPRHGPTPISREAASLSRHAQAWKYTLAYWRACELIAPQPGHCRGRSQTIKSDTHPALSQAHPSAERYFSPIDGEFMPRQRLFEADTNGDTQPIETTLLCDAMRRIDHE